MPQAVDVDLFVNAASKGFNDGAKVASPWASFFEGLFDGAKWAQDYETQALQNEQRRIQIEQAPLQTEILEAQAAQAGITADVINENPDTFKAAAIAEAKAKTAEAERLAIYNTQKSKLIEIMNSGDGTIQGDAYISGDFSAVFAQDEKFKEEYVKRTFENWEDPAKDVYNKQELTLRSRKVNEALYDESAKLFEKYKPDYLSNPEVNILKQMIQEKTGAPVSDAELWEKGTITTIRGPKQIPQMIEQVDPATGKIVMEADGKTPKLIQAPPDKFGNIPFINDPYSTELEKRIVLKFGDNTYEIGGGISSDTLKIFNTMQSSYRRLEYLDKDQDGDTDLNYRAQQKREIETKKTAEAQAKAEAANAEVNSARELFERGKQVATQKWAEANNIVPMSDPLKTIVPGPAGAPPAIPQRRPSITSSDGPTASVAATPSPTPRVLQTATATPMAATSLQQPTAYGPGPVPQATGGVAPTPPPLTPEQQNALIKKQAQAVKSSKFLSKYQQSNTLPVPPEAQAAQVTASPYIPPKVTTNIPYEQDTEAINTVASLPEMQKASALLKAIVTHESRGRNAAVSPTGVTGLAQVTEDAGKSVIDNFDRTDPVQQVAASTILLENWMQRYSNNPMLALTAYNGGDVVVREAIRLAGTTNWKGIKEVLLQAGQSPRAQAAWRRDLENKGFSEKRIRSILRNKPAETAAYAEKVIVNFPAFAYTSKDDAIFQTLKQQGVFTF